MWTGAVADTTERYEFRVSIFALFSFSFVRTRNSQPVLDQFGLAQPVPQPITAVNVNNYNLVAIAYNLIWGVCRFVLNALLWLVFFVLVEYARVCGFQNGSTLDCVRGGEEQWCLMN